MKKIVINCILDEKRVAIMDRNKLAEVIYYRPGQAIVGGIYKGKVLKVVPGMQAAFVDLGESKNGYIHRDDLSSFKQLSEKDKLKKDINHLIHEGQELIVQIIKEGTGTKGPKLTTMIEFTGKHVVYFPNSGYTAVSKKFNDDERAKWQQFARKACKDGEGILIRTSCLGKAEKEVLDELDFYRSSWLAVNDQARKLNNPSILYENSLFVERLFRDNTFDSKDEIIIDDSEIYRLSQKIAHFYDVPTSIIEHYRGKEGIFSYYQVESEIEKALKPKVWLKSGGNIMLDQTEAMTVIDVNTSKYIGKTSQQDTILLTNLEAAMEIARQLKLRDIGGIIIIDFIDMKSNENRKRVLNKLNEELLKDKVTSKVLGFTSLGLVEMTRKRVRPSLSEYILEDCSTCHGKGKRVSSDSMYYQLQRTLHEYKGTEEEAIWVEVPDFVWNTMSRERVEKIEKLCNLKLVFSINPTEEINIRHVGKLNEINERIANNCN